MRSPLPLLVAALLVAAFAFPAEVVDAAWTPVVNPRDMVITQVGRFCVLVYNLPRRTRLELVNVVRGETEPSGTGTTYRLVLNVATTRGGSKRLYQCVVWGVPGSRANTWKLQSFKPINA